MLVFKPVFIIPRCQDMSFLSIGHFATFLLVPADTEATTIGHKGSWGVIGINSTMLILTC